MNLTCRRGKMMSHVKGCHALNARKRLKTRDNTGNLCSPNRTCIRKEKLFKNVVKRMKVMKVQTKTFKNLPFRINIFIYWIQFYLPHTDEEDDFWKTDEIFYMSTIVPLWNFDFRSRQLTVWRKEGRQEGRKEGTNKRTNERTNERRNEPTNERATPTKETNKHKQGNHYFCHKPHERTILWLNKKRAKFIHILDHTDWNFFLTEEGLEAD